MKKSTEQLHKSKVDFVLERISEDIYKEYAVEELADMVSMSKFHFHRIFKGLVGEPVKEYIRNLRLERAAKDLASTDKKIKEIQKECMYGSAEAFSRAFKYHYGVSPTEYRNKFGWNNVAVNSLDSRE